MGVGLKTLVNGFGPQRTKLTHIDPTVFSEADFEVHVRTALSCVYDDYYCIPFRGGFRFAGIVNVADLALIHKRFTHWFVLEVELISHSLHNHVIPQVRCFAYGEPLDSCISYMERNIPELTYAKAATLVHLVPRSVAVIANRSDAEWISALRTINVQFVAVSVFQGENQSFALETDGSLNVPLRSLGFFTYSALNRTIMLNHPCELAQGELLIEDPSGIVGVWTVRHTDDAVWVTKMIGDPSIPDRSVLQIVRTHAGKITLRLF